MITFEGWDGKKNPRFRRVYLPYWMSFHQDILNVLAGKDLYTFGVHSDYWDANFGNLIKRDSLQIQEFLENIKKWEESHKPIPQNANFYYVQFGRREDYTFSVVFRGKAHYERVTKEAQTELILGS